VGGCLRWLPAPMFSDKIVMPPRQPARRPYGSAALGDDAQPAADAQQLSAEDGRCAAAEMSIITLAAYSWTAGREQTVRRTSS